MTIGAGTKLSRYEIRSQLGAGEMDEMYLADATQLDRPVAQKFSHSKSRVTGSNFVGSSKKLGVLRSWNAAASSM
ncbi:MAG TPA: hypothetical protein VFD48_16275 [Pyrinomonadaceae bacterium]|nr:hypothetical protein [Pyrinomonadaceae bacterium]